MTKDQLADKLSSIALNIEDLSSSLKSLVDEAKDILNDIESIDPDDLEIGEPKE